MKPKRIKKHLRDAAVAAFRDNLRVIWARLCALPRRDRLRLAWMLVRGDADLDRVARKGAA
jgi:hypothetical protein